MIRFYESKGLLDYKRDVNGYRIYKEEEVALVKKIIILNNAGILLKDIALLRDCLYDKPQDFCSDLKFKLESARDNIDLQIKSLNDSKSRLDKLLLPR